MSRFLAQNLQRLDPYVPGEQPRDKKYIKLNTNESPYPPAPAVLAAINSDQAADLRLYSDPTLQNLRAAIAGRYQVTPQQVFCGNGSDEVLSFAFRAWGAERGVVFPDLSYGFYPIFADYYGLDAKIVPLREDFTLNPANYENIGRMVVIANPNAPTGLAVPAKAICRIAKTNPETVVLVDEAYVDFGGESCVPLLSECENLVVVQTFSKSRQLAGARLGFALASEELIADLERLRCSFNPYNVNRLTELAGTLAMQEEAWFAACCEKIKATRANTTAGLQALGFTVLPSLTNFIFAKAPGVSGGRLYRRLREQGILVRHFDAPRVSDYVRITIGSDEQMDTLLAAVSQLLQEESV